AFLDRRSVPHHLLDSAIEESLDQQDWATALALTQGALELCLVEGSAGSIARQCELLLSCATAARFLQDSDQAHSCVDQAVELATALDEEHESAIRARVAIARAELLHFLEG